MRAILIGNCQTAGLSRCLRAMNPGLTIERFSKRALQDPENLRQRLFGADFIFYQTMRAQEFLDAFPDEMSRAVLYPYIYFAGYHPDIAYVRSNGALVETPMGHYNSKIILACYMLGLGMAETCRVFCRRVFEGLGYLDAWNPALEFLRHQIAQTSIDWKDGPGVWSVGGPFMYSVNHPRLNVLASLSSAMLAHIGLPSRTDTPQAYVRDDLKESVIWPVYPEIASAIGIAGGDYCFKSQSANGVDPILDLESYIEASFAIYDRMPRDSFVVDRLDMPAFVRNLDSLRIAPARATPTQVAQTSVANPYLGLAPHQIWRSAIASTPFQDVDPVVTMPSRISPSDKVASAGSCFAQHISRRLTTAGLNYHVTEKPPAGMDAETAKHRSFGMYSSRYGNIYTVRQLVQLWDRAFGEFKPSLTAWRRPDGRFVDPFRPLIEPEGYGSIAEVEEARNTHLAAVRELFETLDVLVFTLGLTETWRHKRDGAVLPVAPGVVADDGNLDGYEFVNFSVADVTADLQQFVNRLHRVNPSARMILTVSPVPLVATYENRHVLVSTTYSKSALRAASDQVARNNPAVSYFPSFEIVASPPSKAMYFEPNLRAVTPAGVEHVMRLFLQHACTLDHPEQTSTAARAALSSGYDVVCDEESLA